MNLDLLWLFCKKETKRFFLQIFELLLYVFIWFLLENSFIEKEGRNQQGKTWKEKIWIEIGKDTGKHHYKSANSSSMVLSTGFCVNEINPEVMRFILSTAKIV